MSILLINSYLAHIHYLQSHKHSLSDLIQMYIYLKSISFKYWISWTTKGFIEYGKEGCKMLQKQIHQLHLLRTVDKTLISKIYLQWIYIYQKMKKKLQASIVFTQASNIIIGYMNKLLCVDWKVYKFGTMTSLLHV